MIRDDAKRRLNFRVARVHLRQASCFLHQVLKNVYVKDTDFGLEHRSHALEAHAGIDRRLWERMSLPEASPAAAGRRLNCMKTRFQISM